MPPRTFASTSKASTHRISGGSIRSPLLGLIVLMTGTVVPLDAQTQTLVAGQLVRVTAGDTLPVGPARVVLHRIARDSQGPTDSMVTTLNGRFRFRFRADTTAIHLVSARFAGIEYFSVPVATNPATPDTLLRLVVFDTASTATIAIAMRHIVIGSPEPGAGSRTVVDLLTLRNPTGLTRVSGSPGGAAFSIPLPPSAEGITVESETDFTAEGIRIRDRAFEVLAPIPPGDKQVLLRYEIPVGRRTLTLPFVTAVDTFSLLLEEPTTTTGGIALQPIDTARIDGRLFSRLAGRAEAGDQLELTFPFRGLTPRTTLTLLVGLTLATFSIMAVWLMRRARSSPARPIGPQTPDLITAIARLDERYLGREAVVDPSEWDRYRTERAGLKARLQDLLADGGARR